MRSNPNPNTVMFLSEGNFHKALPTNRRGSIGKSGVGQLITRRDVKYEEHNIGK